MSNKYKDTNISVDVSKNTDVYNYIKQECRYLCVPCDLHMSQETFLKMNEDRAFEIVNGYVKCPNGCGQFLRDSTKRA